MTKKTFIQIVVIFIIFIFGMIKVAASSLNELPQLPKEYCGTTGVNSVYVASQETTELPPLTVSLGEYELTAYCACLQCCGKTNGITATGTQATAGRTIAVDPKDIPYGSHVIINGHEYVAEDCGGAIKNKRIDVYFDTHQEALNFGRQKGVEVFLIID